MAPDLPPKHVLRSDTALREQESIAYTEVVEGSASAFREPQSLFSDVCRNINNATKSQEFVYNNMEPHWGSLVCDSLAENPKAEASRAKNIMTIKQRWIDSSTNTVPRVNFNSFTRTLSVKVMHDGSA